MSQGHESLLQAELPEVVLAPKYGADVMAYTLMHKRERELLYGALFVCGKYAGKNCRAPLVLFPAAVVSESEGYYALRVSLRGARINSAAIEVLGGERELEKQLREILIGDGLSEGQVGQIRGLIDTYCPHVDTSSLLKWPYLETSGSVQKCGSADTISLLSATGLANVERQASTRGVLEELDVIGQDLPNAHSAALRALMGNQQGKTRKAQEGTYLIPATLSASQERIVQSARKNSLTVCHGPPGTGKSYTLAAVALDHVMRGESVLVTSRGDHAVNVLQEKIDAMIGAAHVTVRAGRSEHLRGLKAILSGMLSGSKEYVVDGLVSYEALYDKVEKIVWLIDDAESVLEEEFRKSLQRGELITEPTPRLLEKLKLVWADYDIKRRPLLGEMRYHYQLLQEEREVQLAAYINLRIKCQITKVLDSRSSRSELKRLWEGVRKRKGSAQQSILKSIDYTEILQALPIWLTSSEDVHRVLPLKKEMFDVVIIDEASQCDLASMLPALQRAKRVVIVGDSKQLRHVSFLSKHAMEAAAAEYGVSAEDYAFYNYRNRSLMDVSIDLVEDQKQTGYLNEHFRSTPEIIEFSNRHFYHKRLDVMRERPWRLRKSPESITSTCVMNGLRNEFGVNMREIEAVLDQLDTILQRYKATTLPSIGILSPFRAQVDKLTDRVFERFRGHTLRRLQDEAQLLIGTAHSFQGQERDTMLLSFAVDSYSNHAVLRFLEREDTFNVAITRAKNRQYVFHSVSVSELKAGSLLGSYLHHIESWGRHNEGGSEGDGFSDDVLTELARMGFKAQLGSEVAGVPVDIVVIHEGMSVGIDLVGFPDVMGAFVGSQKAHMLSRAGLRLIPLGYYEWSKKREECCEMLKRQLTDTSSTKKARRTMDVAREWQVSDRFSFKKKPIARKYRTE
jgi:hypothetical protein